jgi:hypothetical protein
MAKWANGWASQKTGFGSVVETMGGWNDQWVWMATIKVRDRGVQFWGPDGTMLPLHPF